MATSGSKDFDSTCQELIRAAMGKIGALGANETPTATEYSRCRGELNRMCKSWQNNQMGLWLNTTVTLFLENAKEYYDLGLTGDRCTKTAYSTTLDAAEASGQTVISVTATTNMVAGQVIGIVLDDDTIHWSTISSLETNDTVTIALALTGAAASGNTVHFYASRSTTLDAAKLEDQKTLSVASTENMAVGQVIGIMLTAETIQWSTISAFNPGHTVTIATGLTGDAASGNAVYYATSVINRPVSINDVRFVNTSGDERIMGEIARDRYMALTDKDSEGDALQYYYDPQLTNGRMYVWPVCDDERNHIELTIREEIEDFDVQSDNADFPKSWEDAIVYNLAIRIAPAFRIEPMPGVYMMAEKLLSEARAADSPAGSIFFQPRFE